MKETKIGRSCGERAEGARAPALPFRRRDAPYGTGGAVVGAVAPSAVAPDFLVTPAALGGFWSGGAACLALPCRTARALGGAGGALTQGVLR